MRGLPMAMVAAGLTMSGLAPLRAQADTSSANVLISTTLGQVVVEVFVDEAPVTARNFLRYVDEARLDSAAFYRSVTLDNQPNDDVRIQVIQGGLFNDPRGRRLDPIAHETTAETGIRHVDGTVSMARAAPGTASSEIFIVIGDQPSLDYGGLRNPDGQGFAAFGRVISGMDIVRSIQSQPVRGQMLITPVTILEVRRMR